jgi:competence ComEA-like helix-hairpin-helix protein
MSNEANETQGSVVDVNTASAEQLSQEVAGIGPVLAERIVAYREAHGRFAHTDDLTAVSGVGPALLARIRRQLTVQTESTLSGVVREIDLAESPAVVAAGEAQEAPAASAPAAQDAAEEEAPLDIPSELEAIAYDEGLDIDEDLQIDEADLDSAPGAVPAHEPAASGAILDQPLDLETESDRAAASPATEQQKETTGGRSEAPPGATPTPAAPAPPPQRSRSFWGGLGLVLLGGLAGVVLTLLVAVIWSGTVDFAPRRQVDALSRNVNTMYANQELAWQRLDELTARADELDRKVKRLEALEKRVSTLEDELRVAETRLASLDNQITALSSGLTALQKEFRQGLAQLDGRLGSVEESLATLTVSVDALSQELDAVRVRVKTFDGFLSGLKSLLHELDAEPSDEPVNLPGSIAPTPTPAKPTSGS